MNTEIKQLHQLLNLTNKTVIKEEIKRLTAPGENYGSLILSVSLSIQNGDEIEELQLVAKLLPPNEYLRQIFNPEITFRNEAAFYKDIVPVLQNFQREEKVEKVIDFTPQFYGSRLNLTESTNVDDDAVLVLKNLKFDDYVSLDSISGLEYNQTKLILDDLAQLHAVSLGLKLRKPEVFKTKVAPFLKVWEINEVNYNKFKESVVLLVDQIQELQPFKERILVAFATLKDEYEPREPFATVSHNDCWIANTMFKFDGFKPIKSKILDFQMCCYGSPARDLVFFLYSSVKSEVVEKYYTDLLQWYHQRFVSVLEDLHCDTTNFSFDALESEMECEAKNTQFGHVAFMLFVIFAVKQNVEDITKLSSENIVQAEFSDALKEKFVFIIRQFVKRNWI